MESLLESWHAAASPIDFESADGSALRIRAQSFRACAAINCLSFYPFSNSFFIRYTYMLGTIGLEKRFR